jgi:ethanolamine utilization cobalamin adenosyltransferase
MKEYGIGSATIYDIQKQKDEMLKFYSAIESTKAITERHVLQKPKLEQLDVVLYEWFMIKRSEGVPISGPMLTEKAKELYAKMELTEECAFSDSWLAGFKTRHGIRKLDISGE